MNAGRRSRGFVLAGAVLAAIALTSPHAQADRKSVV